MSLLVDSLREQYIKQSVPPYSLVTQKCQSQYPTVWIMLQYTYMHNGLSTCNGPISDSYT